MPPLSAAAKDPVRESYARDFIKHPVSPMIMDAEFPEFQTLLDEMEEEVPPITLPCISPLVPVQIPPAPTTSGQKRRAGKDAENAADTGSSGSGSHPAKAQEVHLAGANPQTSAPILNPIEADEPYTRGEAVMAFIASPRLSDADSSSWAIFLPSWHSHLCPTDRPTNKRSNFSQ